MIRIGIATDYMQLYLMYVIIYTSLFTRNTDSNKQR